MQENTLDTGVVSCMVSHHCEFEDFNTSLEQWQVIPNRFTQGDLADLIDCLNA